MESTHRPLDPGAIKLHRRGKGQPLTLLHCLGMSWRFWDVLEPLTDAFELIAYSFPGHHDTPLPDHPYGVPELSRQLYEIFRREGMTKTHLMGISLGGTVAQHFAGTHPDMVMKLVLADCTPRYDEEARANWPKRAEVARRHGVASLIPALLPIWFSPQSLAEDGQNVRFVRETLAACGGEGYALACEALASADVRNQANQIKAATLIIYGSEERQAFREAAGWMHENIRDSRLEVIPLAGHASVRERPEHVIRLLRRFLIP